MCLIICKEKLCALSFKMIAIPIILIFFVQPAICLKILCFTHSKMFEANSFLQQQPNCSHLIIKDFAKIGLKEFKADLNTRYYNAQYLKASAPPHNLKLFAEMSPKNGNTLVFPIGIEGQKNFVQKLKRNLRHLRSLNPLTGKPIFSGLFFRAAAFQKEGEFFGFFPLLAKLREEKLRKKHTPSFGEFMLGIDSHFNPYTIGFPANNSIANLIDIFYLSMMSDGLIKEISEIGPTAKIDAVQLNPLFVSNGANPIFTLIYQKDMLEHLGIFNKTVIGFSALGYEIMRKNDDVLDLSKFTKLNISMICSILYGERSSVLYDRQSLTTSFLRHNTFVIFNMPYQKSLKERVRWISQNDFYGVGFDSMESDLDKNNVCQFQTTFPLHDYLNKINRDLEVEQKFKSERQLKRFINFAKTRSEMSPPINSDVHPISNISIPMKNFLSPYELFDFQNKSESVMIEAVQQDANETDQSSGIANMIEIIDPLKCSELCGVADELFIEKDEHQSFRTVGGEVITDNYYPWVVFVRVHVDCAYTAPIYIHCTGVLISFKHVMTAAHCMHLNTTMLNECIGWLKFVPAQWKKTELHDVYIHFGSSSMSETKIEKVRRISIVKDFDMSHDNLLRPYDVAILELSRTLDRKADNVVPICLYKNCCYNEHMGEMAVVAGYGGFYEDTANYLNKTQTATLVPIRSAIYCNKIYNDILPWKYNPSKFVCASSRNKGITTGDCGGPLMIERNGLYYLIGIVIAAYRPKPGFYRKYVPDVYTRVNSFDSCGFVELVTNNEVTCFQEFLKSDRLETLCDKQHAKILEKTLRKSCEYVSVDQTCYIAMMPFAHP